MNVLFTPLLRWSYCNMLKELSFVKLILLMVTKN